jgi:hypothetical protein
VPFAEHHGERRKEDRVARRRWRNTRIAFAVLVVTNVIALYWVWQNQQDGHRLAARTNASLCTLRGDLEQRAAASEAFLRAHPHGIPGIPAGTLRQSIAGQRRTIDALRRLRCAVP